MPKARAKASAPVKKSAKHPVKAMAAAKTKIKAKVKALSPSEMILKLWKRKQEHMAHLQSKEGAFSKTDPNHKYFVHHKHDKFSRYQAPRRKAS
jgi:hypothetical protein